MGYRITYEHSIKKTDLPSEYSTIRLKKWIFTAVISILIVVIFSNSKMRSYLLPGDPQVTEKAFSELVVDLRQGESVSDAVTAFCREILDNA